MSKKRPVLGKNTSAIGSVMQSANLSDMDRSAPKIKASLPTKPQFNESDVRNFEQSLGRKDAGNGLLSLLKKPGNGGQKKRLKHIGAQHSQQPQERSSMLKAAKTRLPVHKSQDFVSTKVEPMQRVSLRKAKLDLRRIDRVSWSQQHRTSPFAIRSQAHTKEQRAKGRSVPREHAPLHTPSFGNMVTLHRSSARISRKPRVSERAKSKLKQLGDRIRTHAQKIKVVVGGRRASTRRTATRRAAQGTKRSGVVFVNTVSTNDRSAALPTAQPTINISAVRIVSSTARSQTSVQPLAMRNTPQRSRGDVKMNMSFAIARFQSNPISRSRSTTQPMLGLMGPAYDSPEAIFDPCIPDGEDLLSLADIVSRDAGEELLSFLMTQLQEGPNSLESTDIMQRANAALPTSFDVIDNDTWNSLLKETLLLATRQVKVFEENGLRNFDDIYSEAAGLLELSEVEFDEWETHYGVHCIADNLIALNDKCPEEDEEKRDDLIRAIRHALVERACAEFERGDYRDALLYSFETRIQWAIARHSAIPDRETKVRMTAKFIKQIAEENRIAVARALALIVRHSRLSKDTIRRTHATIPHWRTIDVRELFKAIMKDMPSAVSDNCFRSQLTEREKNAVNDVVYRVNQGDIMTTLSRMRSDRPIEDFLEVIDKADDDGRIFLDIALTMLKNREKNELN